MPVSRDTTLDLAQGVVDLYTGLEERLAAALAGEIRRDPDPSELAKLEAVRRLRDGAQRMLDRLESDASHRTYAAVAEAWARGGQAAITEIAKTDRRPTWWERRGLIMRLLGRLIGADRRQAARDRDRLDRDIAELRDALPGVDAINAVARELNDRRASTHGQILRWQDDVYRTVIGEAGLVDVLAGQQTRIKATQASLDRFLAKGVTGYTDSRGHRWSLASYIEMALRSGTARASLEAHTARLADADIDLVIVSDAPQECSVCRPWEGKILARTGPAGRIQVEHTITGQQITVTVAGTIAQALTAGLMHPNCRHSFSAYLPGVTQAPTNTADPDGDAARRRLRELERHVREWKRRHAGALTDDARDRAAAKVKHWQDEIAAHVKATGLLRQRHREQVTVIDDSDPDKQPPRPAPLPQREPQPPDPAFGTPDPDPPTPSPDPDPDPVVEWNIPETGLRVTDMFPPTGHDPDRRDNQRLKTAVNEHLRDGDFGHFNPEVLTLSVYGRSVEWHGEIRDDEGILAGTFQRDFHRDTDGLLWVEHAYLKLERRHQGQGFAKAFNEYLYDWYRDSGVDHVKVHANIDVGGYTWARQGFDFRDEDEAEKVLRRLDAATDQARHDLFEAQNDLDDAPYTGADESELQERVTALERTVAAAEDILERAENHEHGQDDYPTAYEVSQAGRADGDIEWLGKTAMLGSDWYGVRWM